MKQFLKPATRRSFITYAILIAAFIAVEVMVSKGSASNMFKGLLVPMCEYHGGVCHEMYPCGRAKGV